MRGFLWQICFKGITSLKQFERDVARVIDVLHPGPLGITERKFSDTEIAEAHDNAERAVQRWKDHFNNK